MTTSAAGEPAGAPFPGEPVVVGTYRTHRELQERALVVVATIGEFGVEEAEGGGGFRLLVAPRHADRAARELAAYEAESAYWPPPEPRLRDESPNLWLGLLYAAVLMGSFLLQIRRGEAWEDLLLADARRMILGGELWRPFTALLLHADIRHLAGNIAAMLLYILMLSRVLSAWTSWGLTLLAGILGNLTTALFHLAGGHRALGASTAVFGALGLLVGVAVRSRFYAHWGPGRAGWLIPVGGGVAILGLTGAGGPNTDVTAHAAGFFWGLFLGILAARRALLPPENGEVSGPGEGASGTAKRASENSKISH